MLLFVRAIVVVVVFHLTLAFCIVCFGLVLVFACLLLFGFRYPPNSRFSAVSVFFFISFSSLTNMLSSFCCSFTLFFLFLLVLGIFFVLCFFFMFLIVISSFGFCFIIFVLLWSWLYFLCFFIGSQVCVFVFSLFKGALNPP